MKSTAFWHSSIPDPSRPDRQPHARNKRDVATAAWIGKGDGFIQTSNECLKATQAQAPWSEMEKQRGFGNSSRTLGNRSALQEQLTRTNCCHWTLGQMRSLGNTGIMPGDNSHVLFHHNFATSRKGCLINKSKKSKKFLLTPAETLRLWCFCYCQLRAVLLGELVPV